MKIVNVEVEWISNGRVLPTENEQELFAAAICEAARMIAPRFDSTDQIEDAAVDDVRSSPSQYGIDTTQFDSRDIDRILADCIVKVRAV